MKIAILGGGFVGLTACYYLSKSGHEVVVFEKEAICGGLAVGFKERTWDWPLEKAYHHLFANDTDIINFAKDVGFNKIFFESPRTDSLYKDSEKNYRIIPVDSPQDFLAFPYLNLIEKIRGAIFLVLLKFGPKLALYERITAEKFVRRYMGKRIWNVFFQELFRKKYGKYAGKILASFLWARINKRTKKLGYIEQGFQTFIQHVVTKCTDLKARILTSTEIISLGNENGRFYVNGDKYDAVVSTLPTPILTKLASSLLPSSYCDRLSKLQYLHALVLILETKQPILKKTYWLNICTKDIPIMFIGQHTNFISSKHYGGKHIAYIGYYLERDDPMMKMSKEELIEYLMPHLKKISPNTPLSVLNSYRFVGPFAQPLFTREFLQNKPDIITPVENFYMANLDMTYPYDRGTNYAVKLGKQVAEIINKNSKKSR